MIECINDYNYTNNTYFATGVYLCFYGAYLCFYIRKIDNLCYLFAFFSYVCVLCF